MRSPGITLVVFALLLAFLALPLVGQVPSEKVDLDAIYKIKDEGLNRSQVMVTMIPPGSFPGITSFARAPTIKPIIIIHKKCIVSFPFR